MDWTKVKSAIAQVAPWIAGTLGSPVAGVAVQALCGALGLAGDSATPENVITALAGATPQQLAELKAAELKHAEFMQQLGYEHMEQLERATVDDRDSARKRGAAMNDRTPAVLAALAVLMFIGVLMFVGSGQSPAQDMRDAFMLLAGAAITTFKDVYGYYFGSSHGSQAKDATIAAQAGVKQ